jgi:hypothetical protein
MAMIAFSCCSVVEAESEPGAALAAALGAILEIREMFSSSKGSFDEGIKEFWGARRYGREKEEEILRRGRGEIKISRLVIVGECQRQTYFPGFP